MLWLVEASKRQRLRWHEYWMEQHMSCGESARKDMWAFLEIGDQSEAARLSIVVEQEKTLAAYHARHVIDLLDDMS